MTFYPLFRWKGGEGLGRNGSSFEDPFQNRIKELKESIGSPFLSPFMFGGEIFSVEGPILFPRPVRSLTTHTPLMAPLQVGGLGFLGPFFPFLRLAHVPGADGLHPSSSLPFPLFLMSVPASTGDHR